MDPREMAHSIEGAIAAQVDGILLPIMEPGPLEEALEHARIAGIPVIAIEADSDVIPRTAYVGSNPYESGYQAGRTMVQGCNGHANIAILVSDENQTGKFASELEGFRAAIDEQESMRIVTTEETHAELLTAMKKTEAILNRFPEVNAIFGITSYDILGAAKIVEERGRTDMILVGHDDLNDTLDYIRKGIVYAIIVQDPYSVGYSLTQ